MKELRRKQKTKVFTQTSLWEAFLLYLEKMYFPCALEKLDSGLLKYEYEYFKTQHLF